MKWLWYLLTALGGFIVGAGGVVGFVFWAAWQKIKDDLPSDM